MIIAQSLVEYGALASIQTLIQQMMTTVSLWWRVQNQPVWYLGVAILLIWFVLWRRPRRRY